MSLTPVWLDELRLRTPLSVLIGRSVPMTKAGREHKACCPFHAEKTPSFTVNDDKGFYHCFSCGAHGDAIRWMTDYFGLPFIDAVKDLAFDAGLEMPERSAESRARAQRIEGLRPALQAADALYRAGFTSGDAEALAALDYLARRGMDTAAAADFGLGWAPGVRGHISSIGVTREAALAAGLIWHDEASGKWGEYFRKRLMIPVHDRRGRLIGFAGRALDGSEPKYKNSPASELFDKGRVLFNQHRAAEMLRAQRQARLGGARDDAAEHRERPLLIVEGQFDALFCGMAHWPAVAPMGTALTPAQMGEAWRMHPRPVLLMDGDGAGAKAALRACAMMLPMIRPGCSLFVAQMPPGLDPADAVAAGGDALAVAVDAARPLIDHVFAAVRDAAAPDGKEPVGEDAAAVWAELEALARTIEDEETRARYLAGWRSRYQKWVDALEEPDAVRHGVASADKSAAESAALLMVADDEGEDEARRMFATLMRMMDERDEVNERIRDAMAWLKARGYPVKAMRATLGNLRADRKHGPAAREDFEAQWALFRRIMGVQGPMDEAMLPRAADPRARVASGSAVVAKRMAQQAALIDARAIRRSDGAGAGAVSAANAGMIDHG